MQALQVFSLPKVSAEALDRASSLGNWAPQHRRKEAIVAAPPRLESLIWEAVSCPALLGCGGIWGLPVKLARFIPGRETTAHGWLTQLASWP